jgi:hypothetical protein
MEVLHTEQPSRLYLEQRSFASLITGFTIISFKVLTLKSDISFVHKNCILCMIGDLKLFLFTILMEFMNE